MGEKMYCSEYEYLNDNFDELDSEFIITDIGFARDDIDDVLRNIRLGLETDTFEYDDLVDLYGNIQRLKCYISKDHEYTYNKVEQTLALVEEELNKRRKTCHGLQVDIQDTTAVRHLVKIVSSSCGLKKYNNTRSISLYDIYKWDADDVLYVNEDDSTINEEG